MKANYYALYLAIKKDISIDAALGAMGIRAIRKPYTQKNPKKKDITEKEFEYIDDPLKLIELKKKHTYDELARMYNTYPDKVYRNIKYYKQVSLQN